MSWLKNIVKSFSFFPKKMSSAPLDISEMSAEENAAWWGHFLVAADQSRYSKIGPVILCIDHYNQEWKLASSFATSSASISNTSLSSGASSAPGSSLVSGTNTPSKILGSHLQQDEIYLKPVLADRNLQVKLSCPIYLSPGETLNLYASSPTWIRIEIGDPALLLDEIPTEILADTWFGENTLSGDLCYAATQTASPRLDELLLDTTHVTSSILLQNFSKDRVYVKELSIPLPFLSVYSDGQNQLWTEQILIIFETADVMPRTTITQGMPKHLINPSLLSFPRIPVKATFKNFFTGGKKNL